jgi:hypothetical protein
MGSNKVTPNKHNLVQDVKIAATKKLYLDGGGDTYIHETSADIMEFIVGGDTQVVISEDGDDGNFFQFKGCSAGFRKLAETFSDDSIIGSGGTDDTHIDFRHTNKISLAVTGNITNLNLIFPPLSGNFILLLTYDGDHTITNYKVYEDPYPAYAGQATTTKSFGNDWDYAALQALQMKITCTGRPARFHSLRVSYIFFRVSYTALATADNSTFFGANF